MTSYDYTVKLFGYDHLLFATYDNLCYDLVIPCSQRRWHVLSNSTHQQKHSNPNNDR